MGYSALRLRKGSAFGISRLLQADKGSLHRFQLKPESDEFLRLGVLTIGTTENTRDSQSSTSLARKPPQKSILLISLSLLRPQLFGYDVITSKFQLSSYMVSNCSEEEA